jgi:hypothetical protein
LNQQPGIKKRIPASIRPLFFPLTVSFYEPPREPLRWSTGWATTVSRHMNRNFRL